MNKVIIKISFFFRYWIVYLDYSGVKMKVENVFVLIIMLVCVVVNFRNCK